jgi:hypothetical protein
VWGNRKFSEMTMTMSFLASSIEPPHAAIDSNLTDRITLTFRTHNAQE